MAFKALYKKGKVKKGDTVAFSTGHPGRVKRKTDSIRFVTEKICHDGACRYFYNRWLDDLSGNHKTLLSTRKNYGYCLHHYRQHCFGYRPVRDMPLFG